MGSCCKFTRKIQREAPPTILLDMKRPLTPIALLFALAILALAFCTQIFWSPTDAEAALAWNLGIILAPVFALIVQYKIAGERRLPIVLTLTVVAIINTTIVLGSRLGAWKGVDWVRALTGNGLPDLPGKTIMGGLVLALIVYAILKKWWRLPAGLADVLVLGLPLAAVSGRVGCLLAGCCYGVPTGSDWGICYGPGTPAYLHQTQSGQLAEGAVFSSPLFPIQLFLIGGNLLIFILLWHYRKRFSRIGALACLGLALLTFQRFGIEFMRDVATNRGGFGLMWGGIKMAQWAALLMALGSMAGFCYLQFFQKKNTARVGTDAPIISTLAQATALGVITLGGFLVRNLLTFDEAMVILASCAPAVLMLGRQLWRERSSGRPVLATATMLSATAMVVLLNPLDTIAPNQNPREWKQWVEVGAAGSFGSYKVISRDCDGNVIREDIIKANSGGGEINANWQRGWTKLQVSLRGAFGKTHPEDNNEAYYNFRYSSFGLQGRASSKWIGGSLGLFNRQQNFKFGGTRENYMLPSMSLRLGRPDRYSIDFRFYDEPTLGLSNVPPFSMGLFNWGFNDRSGNSLLRVGFAITSPAESAFHLAGQFPLGQDGVIGSFSAYIGKANMVGFGLRYRFKEQ